MGIPVKLFLKNSNACLHNPPTSQTDTRTTYHGITALRGALCGKKAKAPLLEHIVNWFTLLYPGANISEKLPGMEAPPFLSSLMPPPLPSPTLSAPHHSSPLHPLRNRAP